MAACSSPRMRLGLPAAGPPRPREGNAEPLQAHPTTRRPLEMHSPQVGFAPTRTKAIRVPQVDPPPHHIMQPGTVHIHSVWCHLGQKRVVPALRYLGFPARSRFLPDSPRAAPAVPPPPCPRWRSPWLDPATRIRIRRSPGCSRRVASEPDAPVPVDTAAPGCKDPGASKTFRTEKPVKETGSAR